MSTEYLSLDLDEVIGEAEYFCTPEDVGGYAHRIIIKAKDKKKFLDSWSKEWRERAETALQPEPDFKEFE